MPNLRSFAGGKEENYTIYTTYEHEPIYKVQILFVVKLALVLEVYYMNLGGIK